MRSETADVCGTVMCDDDCVSLPLFSLVSLRLVARSLLGSLGSLGVGVQRSGCAIWASRVSNGKREAFGRPVIESALYLNKAGAVHRA